MKGHVRERGKGNWYAVLSTRDQQTGKRKVKFISLPDARGKREAQQALAHILAELDSGTLSSRKRPPWRYSWRVGWCTSKRKSVQPHSSDTANIPMSSFRYWALCRSPSSGRNKFPKCTARPWTVAVTTARAGCRPAPSTRSIRC